jgi:hypothetical protein
MHYRHTQTGYLVLAAFAAAFGTVAYIGMTHDQPTDRTMAWLAAAILAVCGVLFGSLTVEVDAREVRLYFGPRFWRRSVPLEDVQAAEVVRNSPVWGWGIRWIPRGWLYNVSGLGAVELTLRNGRRLRIGTDEPDRLVRAIQSARSVLVG